MTLRALFARRVRGFRLVELVGLAVLAATILGVYLGKAVAGREEAAINSTEKEILALRARVRMLNAEVAFFESPERLEHLSTQLSLGPIKPTQELTLDHLSINALSARPVAAAAPVQTAPPPEATPVSTLPAEEVQ